MSYNKFSKVGVSVALAMFATGVAESQSSNQNDLSLYPPNAQPGECYAKVLLPAKYDLVSEKVIKREASEEVTVVPAKYEWVEERIQVREATERLEVVPASFRWKKGRGPIEKIDNVTGEILCLVVEPATYKTINRTIVKAPASTRSIDVPPTFKTIRKQVVDRPAEVRKLSVPAEFSTVKVRKMVEPPREQRVSLPPEFQTVTKRVKTQAERLSWQPILCETNVNQNIIAEIQQALKSKGFNPGDVDGVLGSATLNAVEAFQRRSGLARGGVTMETLQALEVKLN